MGLLYCLLIFFFVACIIFPLSVLSYIEASITLPLKRQCCTTVQKQWRTVYENKIT